jgi:hypothetical protein
MRNFVLFISVFVLSSTIHAQTDNDYLELSREVLKTEKKAAIAEVLQLTEAESQPFWNLYNEYQGELYKVHNQLVAIIKDYAENFENLTEVKADELWMNTIDYQQALIKLQKSYYAKFKKILPVGKAAKYFQAENKIDALIKAALALEIPLLVTE